MPSWKKVITSGSDATLTSVTATAGFTGSLLGTASYATNALNALSASYALNGGVTQLLAGPNVTLSPTNGLGQVTVSATLSGSTSFNTATGSYGSFYDTTTQTNPVANIARSMSFNSTDITNGVSISGSTNPFNTYVKTTNAGIYNIQFSAQIDKTDSGADEIVIWLRKNGIDLTDTATTLTLSGNNDKQVAAWNWFVTSAAGDYYQIIWISADIDLRLLAEPISGTHPGIPSVIATVNRVDQFLSNTGSFSGSFTGNLIGTASYATQALSASFATTASYSNNSTSASSAASAAYATTANDATSISSSITNNTDNRVLTATGTGVINGEANLTFDSQLLTLTNGILTFAGSTFGRIQQSPGGAANGLFSHAQGLAVGAYGEYSHAEGSSTSAFGFGSHAEGSGSATSTSKLYGAKFNTITSGVFQLAGDVTAVFAPGNRLYYNSAAYPDNTSFVVNTSVFGGVNTTITLNNTGINDSNFSVGSLDYAYTSWAGDLQSVSNGGHAEGYNTTAVADWSHAEGLQTQTFARYSHAEGSNTQANGKNSHAEGSNTKTFGDYSHAEGSTTQTNGPYSHAEGSETTTGNLKGYYATMTASGVFTISSTYGDLSGLGLFDAGYIIGVDDSRYDAIYTYINLIATSCSFNGTNTLVHVTDTVFLTSTASIGSITNFASNTGDQYWGGFAAHAQGNSTIAQGLFSHAEGGGRAYGNASHAEGSGIAYGNASHAEGGGQAYGNASHAEGGGIAYGNASHAEGSGIAGWIGYSMSESISAGVIKLQPVYGDRINEFVGGGFVLIQDDQGQIAGVPSTYRYEISSSAFTSSLTQIQLYDTSVSTANEIKITIGVYESPNPPVSDIPAGNASHAEGGGQAYGVASHAAGLGTQTLGWYQSVVGQGNIPLSSTSSFIVGNGSYDDINSIWTRSNLLVAEGNTVQISGSLQVSGSLTVSGSLRGQVSALSISSNTASIDMSTNNFFTLALVNGANTHINPTNINPGQTVNILVTQGAAGTGTVTFPSLVKQPSGSLYTGTAAANAIDIVTMIAFDSTNVYVSSVRNMI